MTEAANTPDPDRWQALAADLEQQITARQAKIEDLTGRKRELALAAATGSEAERKRLAILNREIVAARLELEDLELALEQARGKLVEAEAEVARRAEAARRKRVSDLAEGRVELATRIDGAAEALGGLLGELDQATRAMVLERPEDEGFARRVDAGGRVLVVLARHLGAWIGQVGECRSDPRHGRTLEHLEIEALSNLILTQAGIERKGRAACWYDRRWTAKTSSQSALDESDERTAGRRLRVRGGRGAPAGSAGPGRARAAPSGGLPHERDDPVAELVAEPLDRLERVREGGLGAGLVGGRAQGEDPLGELAEGQGSEGPSGEARPCEHCGRTFEPTHRGGHPPRYCSRTCRSADHARRSRARRAGQRSAPVEEP